MTSLRRYIPAVAVTLALVPAGAFAQADPPARAARVSFVGGQVSFRPASVDEWTPATINYPVTIGDHLWTDRDGRAELEIGRVVVRLAASTELSVLNLDDRVAQFRLTQGSAAVRVRSVDPDDAIEIDTPNGAVALVQPGFYRVDVAEAGDATTIVARSGRAEVTAPGTSFAVFGNQSATLMGVDQPDFEMRTAAATDPFEDWCLVRDRQASTEAVRYVSPDMIGYSDLDDRYGAWQTDGEYGAVWYPRVVAGWAPYRFGHWAWVEPWGWTWIDDEPWGFAPFHYGRWVYLRGGWGWMPGAIVARPVYAPALVAFVGGPGWRASASLGATPVAWVPLGPREPYVPGYHVSPGYVRTINAPHVTNVDVTTINVTNITYVNRGVPGAVTAVPRDVFVRARPVAPASVAVPREAVQTAPVVGTAAPVAPEHASIVGAATGRAPAPPASLADRRVIVRTPPPDRAHVPARTVQTTPAPAAAPAPQPVARPRDDAPRPVETPRVETPRAVETPRPVETPRAVETPRRVPPPEQKAEPRAKAEPEQKAESKQKAAPEQKAEPKPKAEPRQGKDADKDKDKKKRGGGD